MALFDRASLVQIPSGYKEGKLYNIKPFDQPFEFERGSAATRVNEDGLIETLHDEATNLLLQSNNFDTTWSSGGITETSGQSGYDGTNDAWLIEKSNISTRVEQSVSGSGITTFSVYLKKGTLNFAILNLSSFVRYFDLENGTLGSKSGLTSVEVNSGIESVGNGWYRCYITTNQSYTIARIYPARANGDNSGTSGNILIQDAQLEEGYFATPYIETTTEAVTRPNRHDTPRIDYTDGKALLLEPQRSNEVTYSENFTDSSWSKSNFTSNSNTTIAPDGSIINGYDFGDGYIYADTINLDGVSNYTNSIYIKANKSATIGLRDGGAGSASNNTDINLTTDWVRFTATSSSTSVQMGRLLLDNRASSSYGVSDLKVFIFGAQFEQGSYATSYIPTNGQTETRLADVCNGGGDADTFNDSEGVLYAEIDTDSDTINNTISLSDGTSSNAIRLGFSTTQINYTVYVSGFQVNNTQIRTTSGFNKVAIKYKANDFALWVNGVELNVDSSGSLPADGTFNRINFDRGDNPNPFYGKVKALTYFPEALTDTELQELTTI